MHTVVPTPYTALPIFFVNENLSYKKVRASKTSLRWKIVALPTTPHPPHPGKRQSKQKNGSWYLGVCVGATALEIPESPVQWRHRPWMGCLLVVWKPSKARWGSAVPQKNKNIRKVDKTYAPWWSNIFIFEMSNIWIFIFATCALLKAQFLVVVNLLLKATAQKFRSLQQWAPGHAPPQFNQTSSKPYHVSRHENTSKSYMSANQKFCSRFCC